MDNSKEPCLVCGARNPVGAPWCARCQTRFDRGEESDASSASSKPLSPDPAAAFPAQHPTSSGGLFVNPTRFRPVLALVLLLVTLAYLRLGPVLTGQRAIAGSQEPGGYRFMFVDEKTGLPVRYDACEPIHYVINHDMAPTGGVEDVKTAIEMTSGASGLRFVYDGLTDEVPTGDRELYQPDRYGDRWAPVLFAWTDGPPALDGKAKETTIGQGGSAYEYNDRGQPVYVSGIAAFNRRARLRPGFGGETWGQAILHELGHVVGLDHVSDSGSVMNPTIDLRAATWMEGDRDGLWELGLAHPCLTAPSPH